MSDQIQSQRLDKWLWHARFFKTRTLAGRVISEGKVRVDGTIVSKPSRAVRAGMVLTFTQAKEVRVVCIEGIGDRRGPAPEAQALYTDLTPPKPPKDPAKIAPRPVYEGGGRPTKKQRRQLDRFDGLE
ncbi:RNA-binding S4 domain-containing protein [Nereida sp. MMG025]|uniref:RNA-binding S4 domain-containing protein n=1 Tax=Nereida sp. MMG025 TaxID=2909981 RepID=UPI001F26B543|nr:S4 domain-containing protein [Nereida sp. MMG025]MCF6445168.1 RNA-binding S4 domain-containing protein [Nereida sp. MMG025]